MTPNADIDSIVAHAQEIEWAEPVYGLRPWFDIRGVVGYILDVFGDQDDLYDLMVSEHPDFIPGRVAAAIRATSQGRHWDAWKLLSRAQALSPQDIFIQDLVAENNLAIHGTRGGQAPPQHWQGRFCPSPFEYLKIIPNGSCYCCCPENVPYILGNIYTQSVDEIWNSPTAEAIRESILDGTFRYCSKLHCDALLNGTLPKMADSTPKKLDSPRLLNLGHDLTCNLSCPSCRTHVISADDSECQKLASLVPKLKTLMEGADFITLLSSGDPFASAHCRELLKNFHPRKDQWLTLYTNAQLFTPERWGGLWHLEAGNICVDVSIDAATAATYETVRRGGSWKTLQENLLFINALREVRIIARFEINMTVQACNFMEMLAFEEMGKAFGVDKIILLRLRNWGTFSHEEYAARDVCSPTHPDHAEYQELLGQLSPNTYRGTLPIEPGLQDQAETERILDAHRALTGPDPDLLNRLLG